MKAATVRVWDVFSRLFHWGLVLCIGIAWLTANTADGYHAAAGYVAGGLVIGRWVWGFIGSRYARFSQFVRTPRAVIAYLHAMLAHREARHLGHNPAGGAMIVALMLLVATTCISGWMMTTDAYWGVAWVQQAHEMLTDTLLVLMAVHVGGVVVASVRHRENLVLAMLTGRKRAPGPRDVD